MLDRMGKFTAIGMRTKVEDPNAMVINTCGDNDTAGKGNQYSWVWSNPTNRAIVHTLAADPGIKAVSVECLWQGTKIFVRGGEPDTRTLNGEWRRGKAKRPIGAWNGIGRPLITDPGEARRKIYIPAFSRLIAYWLRDPEVAAWVEQARNHPGDVYLRDFDTGRGVDRNGPMSHAYVLAVWLNTGNWPS